MNRAEDPRDDEVLTILLYASDRTTVRTSGWPWAEVALDLPPVRVLEVATQAAVISAMDAGGIDWRFWMGRRCPVGWGCAANSRTRFCAVRRSWC